MARCFWYQETFRVLGYDKETKPIFERVLDRVHPEDLSFVRRPSMPRLATGKALMLNTACSYQTAPSNMFMRSPDPLEDLSGRLEFVGAVSDVTAAKMADAQIRQNEREFRQIVDAIPQLITVLAADGRALYVNQPVVEFTGLSRDDILGGALRERLILRRIGSD